VSEDVTVIDIAGVPVAMVLPVVPEDAPERLREGIARRRLVMINGQCPCGAERTLPNRAQRRAMKRDAARGSAVWHLTVQHEPNCPANDHLVLAALKEWRR
jgi:hypothetical protein